MKKFLGILVIVVLVCQSLTLIGPIARAVPLYLHDDFYSNELASWDVILRKGSGDYAMAGIPDSGATDGKVLKLLFPANDPSNHPLDGPTVESTQEYSYGTFRARMKAASCNSNEGVVSAFFLYWADPITGDTTEIDFEILGASPYIVYMTIWTFYTDNPTTSFSKTTRAVDLRTGEIWESAHPAHTYDLPQNGYLPQTIPGYDSSADYYEYGFAWLQNSVDFFIVDAHGNIIDLWNTPGDVPIPTHPAQICFEVWHPGPPGHDGDTSWTPVDKSNPATNPPSSDAVALVDWVDYKSETAAAIEKSLHWLRDQQNIIDGSWSYDGVKNVGITSLSALAFLNWGTLDAPVERALDWIVSKRQAGGSLDSGAVSREDNRVYETSMAILALVAGNSLGYKPSDGTNLNTVINNAVAFLLKCQCVGVSLDGYTYGYSDLNYGGWGYPRYDWSDLSNTQWALLAVTAAAAAKISAIQPSVWEDAAVFTVRCLNSVTFNPKWHTTNDGGFTYRPGGASYESMTGAGVWSLGLCMSCGINSVTVDGAEVSLDKAIDDGYRWLQTYGAVDQNYPSGNSWYYYSLLSVAKGYAIVSSSQGADWYERMVSDLESKQDRFDGHWPSMYWEEPDVMATAEAILAIETQVPPPPGISTVLHVILGSYANLYITDPQGRHIGIDPATGQVVDEIPNATFSTNLEQNASIPDPLTGDYNISVYGTGTGPYNLTVEGVVNGTATSSTSFPGTALQGVVREWTATIARVVGPLTVFVTPNQVHDVAVTNVVADRTWIYQGFNANINVTVLNKGNFDENVTVTLYCNITANKIIGTQNVTLSAGQNETIAFVWDTTGVPYCHNYTLTTVASIPADNNPADNTLGGGPVKVRILGDMNGDGTVDIYDAITFANSETFGSQKGDARWNADADINRDGITDIFDAIIIARHFGISSP